MFNKKYIQLFLPSVSTWPVQVNPTPSSGDLYPNMSWILVPFSPLPKSIMVFFWNLSPLYRAYKNFLSLVYALIFVKKVII